MDYDKLIRLARKLISRRTQRICDAEDLAQSAIRGCLEYEAGSPPEDEVVRRMFHKATDWERRTRDVEPLTESKAGAAHCEQQEAVEQNELLSLLPALIAELPPDQKRVAQLLRRGKTAKDIAVEFGVGMTAAYSLQRTVVASIQALASEVS